MNATEPTYYLFAGKLFHAVAFAKKGRNGRPRRGEGASSNAPQPRRGEGPAPEAEGSPELSTSDDDELTTDEGARGERDDGPGSAPRAASRRRGKPARGEARGPSAPALDASSRKGPDANPIDPRIFREE